MTAASLPTKAHDIKCFELAEHFFGGKGDEDAIADLAQTIQDAIEDWMNDRDNAAEAVWMDRQQSLMESGGPDDSAYRRDMIEAGRGHLLR